MERASTASTKLAASLGLAVLAWCAYRASTAPVSANEAVLYDHLARFPVREAILQPDAWRGFLYPAVARRATGLFRLSEFTFRLPALLAGAAFLWIAFRMTARRRIGFVLLCASAAATPVFCRAGGASLASAFLIVAADLMRKQIQLSAADDSRNLNLAGMLIGLAIAASWSFAVAAVVLSVCFLAGTCKWQIWVERLVATACVTAFVILFLPAVHGAAVPRLREADPYAVRDAVAALRADSGSRPVRISVSPDLESYLSFYKARYRIRAWEIVPGSQAADYDVSTQRGLAMPVLHGAPVFVYRLNPARDGGFQPPVRSGPQR